MSNVKEDSPTTGSALRSIINRIIEDGERRKAEKDTCGNPQCRKKSALATVSFRGLILGKLCRFCPWTTFAVAASPEVQNKPKKLARKS